MAKFKPYDETHMRGYMSIEIPNVKSLKDCDFGIQIGEDGRVWICVDDQAFIRFRPSDEYVSDTNRVFKALNESNKEKKKDNVQKSTQLLIDHEIAFTPYNNGIHLVVHSKVGDIDFWPSTGRWIPRDASGFTPDVKQRGIFNMFRFIGEEVADGNT